MSEIFDISFDKIGVIKNLWEKNRQYHEFSSEYFSETYRNMCFDDRIKVFGEFDKDMLKITVAKDNDEYIGYCISTIVEGDLEPEPEEITSYKDTYEVIDGETAGFFSYDYKNRSMYIAGLKVFEEFGTSNEGSVSIGTDENTLTFRITKATGTVSGTVDGPFVYFKMDLTTN